MSEKFYTILTNIGKAKIANSAAFGTQINLVKFKVGDSNGKYYEPSEAQTNLVNPMYEGNINNIEVDLENSNWLKVQLLIPANVGGFTIREYGIFDNENNMIAIAKCAESYKPLSTDGSTKELELELVIAVSNTETINMQLNPSIIFITKDKFDILKTQVNTIATEIQNARGTYKNLKDRLDFGDTQSSERVKKSSVAITYYISTTGNDTNDGLTSGTAFKTIQHAIDILPQVVNHVVVINILSGTYNEAVNLYGYSGYGSIAIKGGIDLATAVNYLVTNVNVKNCSCAINITGITATITTANAFASYANVSCIFAYCNTTVSALSYNGFYITSSLCYINGCNISNRYRGITADYMSTVCSNANTGSGNTTGLYSILGSTIAKNGTQPSATTAETTTSGGVIR